MRILVLQSGRCEHFLAATRAAAARYPDAGFVGLVRDGDHEQAVRTGLFTDLHSLPTDLRHTHSLPICNTPFDACVVPFEDRLGVEYWHVRLVPLRIRVPVVCSYDRRGWLKARSWSGWFLNTLIVSFAIRPVHQVALRMWLRMRPYAGVAGLFTLALLALGCRAATAVGLYPMSRRVSAAHMGGARRLVLFIPSLGVGGAQRQLVSFLTNLNREQWEPELVTMEMADKFFEPTVRKLGIPIRYLNPRGEFWMAGIVWRLADYLRRNPCHVLHGWLHYAAALGAIAGSLAGVPTIVGSLRSERPGRFPWFYPRWQRAIDILTAPLHTYLIANSQAVREENRRWALIPRRKLLTVYNGIDLTRIDVPDRDRLACLRRDLGLPRHSSIVGIVGRLFPEKDHGTFLRAARRVVDARSDTNFLIVGDGAYRDVIEQEVKRLHLDGHMHLLGNRNDVLSLIRLMDVHVLTSLSEGFPNVLLEAAAVGTPVVTTAAGGAAEVVVDGVTGYVVPCGDDEAIARRVLEILESPTLRRALAQAARDRVARLFAAEQVAAAIEDSYLHRGRGEAGRDGTEQALRVCFISPYAYGVLNPNVDLPVGGAEVQVCRLALELAKDPRFAVALLTGDGRQRGRQWHRGCEVVLSPLLGANQQRRGNPGTMRTSSSEIGAGIRRRLARTPLGWLKQRWGEVTACFAWIRNLRTLRPDIVVVRCAGPHVGYIQRACRLLGARFVYQVAHEQDVNGLYAHRHGIWGARFESGLRRADIVICQLAEQMKVLSARYAREGRLIRSLCPPPVSTRSESSRRRMVLWMARLDRWKQPELFLELAARIPDRNFVMVGPASETDPADLTALQARIKSLPNVVWVPGLPFEKAARLFEEAWVLVNTSQAEGFPNTFMQAAAAGTPIVSWSVDPDLVLERHRIGICAGQNWDTFEQSVRRLCADEDLRARLGESGRRYVSEYHDPCRIAAEYGELFLSLVNRGPASHGSSVIGMNPKPQFFEKTNDQ